jgi:predicted DNA-binding protein
VKSAGVNPRQAKQGVIIVNVKYISTNIRLTEEQYERLRDEAHITRKSQAEIIREALENHWKGEYKMNLEEIIRNAEEIEIVSGEGEQGTVENYDGERTAQALKNRLKEEWCKGDRWSYARVDGVRYDIKNDTLEPRY